MSIQLNGFQFGSTRLDSTQIFPPHKKNSEQLLAKIFQRQKIDLPSKGGSVQIKLNLNKPQLVTADQKILLEKSGELKQLGRIVRFYQHTEQLPKAKLTVEAKKESDAQARGAIKAVHDASIPGTNGQILAGMRIADDTLSLARNILFALPEIGPKDPIVSHLGYYAGLFWAFFALRELDDGIVENKRSKVIGDGEGTRRAGARVLSGTIISTASLGYLAGKFCNTYASSVAASGVLGAANVLFGVGSVLAMGSSLLGALRSSRFNDRLDEYLENTTLSEIDRLKSALKFLKESITVTAEEKAALTQEIDEKHPSWSESEKTRLLKQRLADLTEVKVKYMKRRTSTRSLALILNQADSILAQMDDPKTRASGIAKATVLIHQIQKDSRIKKALYILGFVAALVSFVAMLIITFVSSGALPFVLYGVAATIYLLISIYAAVGMICFKKEQKPIEHHLIQDLPHISPY